MKKLLSVFIISCMLLSLCGCGADELISSIELPPVPTSADSVQPEPESSTPGETQQEHVIIHYMRSAYEDYDPQYGEQLILSYSYETPYVYIPNNYTASDRINEVLAMLSESYFLGEHYGVVYDSGCAPGYSNMLTMAEDNYHYIVTSGIEYAAYELANHRTFTVRRCDERVLSLRYYDYLNLGGVHGSYNYRGYNFDTASGELLTLDSISDNPEGFKAFVKDYMLTRVAESAELQQMMMGFVDVPGMLSTEQALESLVREGSWYMDDKGLYIFSDLYEFASYAAGTMEFFFPYSAIEPYLKAEYIPEPVSESGSFELVPLESTGESDREIIDVLRPDGEAPAFYLVANGTVHNVRISRVDYIDRFFETEQLWVCSEMSNCALQLETYIPEGMPELKISYTDAYGEHSYYLSQSGIDGSLILVDDNIQAVG